AAVGAAADRLEPVAGRPLDGSAGRPRRVGGHRAGGPVARPGGSAARPGRGRWVERAAGPGRGCFHAAAGTGLLAARLYSRVLLLYALHRVPPVLGPPA